MFRSTVFGFCLPTRSCSCRSINSHGFERGRSNRFQKFSGRPPTISIGRCWTSIYRCSPYETHPHFRWFQALRADRLTVADTQQKDAAARRMLPRYEPLGEAPFRSRGMHRIRCHKGLVGLAHRRSVLFTALTDSRLELRRTLAMQAHRPDADSPRHASGVCSRFPFPAPGAWVKIRAIAPFKQVDRIHPWR